MDINPYSQPIQSRRELPNYNWNLLEKVLETKQNKFNQNLQALQSQKNTALNIQFINKERQGEVDKLNQDLQDKFNGTKGEFGDLSDNKNYNSYLSWFDNFSKNTDLISAYKVDKKWQDDMNRVGALKNSKDPVKAGYSAVNEAVFNHRLNEYANSGKGKTPEFRGYTNYSDTVAEATKIYKSMPAKKWKEDVVLGNGRVMTMERNGYTQEEVKALMGSMSGGMQEQFKVEAEYNMLQNKNNPDYRNNLHDQYVQKFTQQRNSIDNKLNEAKQRLALSTDDNEKAQFNQAVEAYTAQITDLNLDAKSKDWFATASDNSILNIQTQLHIDDKLNGIAKGLSTPTSKTVKIDQAYFADMNLAQRANQFNATLGYKKSQDNINNQFKVAQLGIEREKMNSANALKMRELGIKEKKADGTEVDSGVFSDTMIQGEAIANNIKKYDYNDYAKTENTLKSQAVNIADGSKDTFDFLGRKQTKDEIIQRFVEASDNPRMYNELMDKMGDLRDNASVMVMSQYIPLILAKAGVKDLSLPNKVGAIKQVLGGIFNGDTATISQYSGSAAQHAVFNNAQSQYKSFIDEKAYYYNKATKELGINTDYNQMDSGTKDKVSSKFMELYYTGANVNKFSNSVEDYSDISESPKKEQIVRGQDRAKLAQIIRTTTGYKGDINPAVISSATVNHVTGDVTVRLKYGDDWKKAYGDSDVAAIDSQYGNLEAGGTLKINVPALKKQTNAVDNVIARGDKYTDHININGVDKIVSFYKMNNFYYVEMDGKIMSKASDQSPSEAFSLIKDYLKGGGVLPNN